MNRRGERKGAARLTVLVAIVALATAWSATGAGATRGRGTTGAASGTLVIGAEQEPDCADWIASCSGASWGFWTMNVTTMPRSFDPVKTKNGWGWKPNSMLKRAPKLETSPEQKVTYEIADQAVWSDGEPITSHDFKYTWDQIANGTDIYDRTGYKDIGSVDDSNPSVAVVTFTTTYAAWKQLFGGQYGILPSHLLEGKDRDAIMKDGYTFSAGPWKIDSWEKGNSVTLVPNDRWWGKKPAIAKIIFKFVTDTSAEFQAYKGGEVQMIYPQPAPDVVDAIKAGGIPGNTQYSADTGNAEALWMNNDSPPFDDKLVRQAFSYAVDRVAVVKRLFGALGVKKPLDTINPPIVSAYADTKAFSGYKRDLKKVDKLMKQAGYKKKGGIWTKGSRTTEITFKTTEGNARRKLTLEVIQSKLGAAGFKANIVYVKAGDLFGEQLPAGDFQVALYAQVNTAPEPGLCALFCSENIPGPANQDSGQNWTRTNIKKADPQLSAVDHNLDDAKRMAAGKKADKYMAADATVLPIDPLPNILLWSKSIKGKVGDQPILGPFWNANEWTLTG